MTDTKFRNGVIAGAVAALGLAYVFSGDSLTASSDKYGDEGEDIKFTLDLSDNDGDRGDLARRTPDLDDFDRILLKGAVELNVEVGESQAVELRATEDHIDAVDLIVEDRTLIIDMSDKRRRNFWNNAEVNLNITIPTMRGLQVNGAGDIRVSNLDEDEFDIVVKGAGDFNFDGKCGTLNVDMRGAGDIDADKLKCKDVTVELRGVGAASVYASESVNAELAGLGSIDVEGNPAKVNKRVGGLGTISID